MPRLSENAISFFGAGGHKHDGVSSTLISTTSYSLFDFNPGYIGSQSRITIQQGNQAALEEWVMGIVNTKVLAPAGLDLAPGLLSGKSIRANTITAVELQANTITASELTSNLVLVNNVIRSSNYNGTIAANGAIAVGGNTGWAITSFGSAEFANVSIRGSVVATNLTASTVGTIGGWQIGSTTLTGGPVTLSSSGYLQISTSDAYETYTIDLNSGGLSSIRFRDNQYSQFQILSTQTRSDSFFTEYSANNVNLKNTVIQTASSISLQTKPISPSYTLSETVALTTGETIADQANGRVSVYSKNSSGSILRQINLDNGVINSYSYEGNGNVAGTGNASYHPSGIYSTGTNWLYGTVYLNGNTINGAGGIYTKVEIAVSDAARTRSRVDVNSLLFWNSAGAQKSEYSATGFYVDSGYCAGEIYANTITGPAGSGGGRLRDRSNDNDFSVNWPGSAPLEFYIENVNVKNFTIQHPLDESKWLLHACAEGLTADVFYRGEGQLVDGECTIILPEYFESITLEENRTVIVTPICDEDNKHPANIAASRVKDGKFWVTLTGGYNVKNQKFYWRVDAIRKNAYFNPEPFKDSVEIFGNGPYTYSVEK